MVHREPHSATASLSNNQRRQRSRNGLLIKDGEFMATDVGERKKDSNNHLLNLSKFKNCAMSMNLPACVNLETRYGVY